MLTIAGRTCRPLAASRKLRSCGQRKVSSRTSFRKSAISWANWLLVALGCQLSRKPMAPRASHQKWGPSINVLKPFSSYPLLINSWSRLSPPLPEAQPSLNLITRRRQRMTKVPSAIPLASYNSRRHWWSMLRRCLNSNQREQQSLSVKVASTCLKNSTMNSLTQLIRLRPRRCCPRS